MWIISLLFTLVAIILHLSFHKSARTTKGILEVILRYYFLIMVGLGGLMAFVGHALAPDYIASLIGWQPSPFEYEIAISNLAFGVLGIVAFWIKQEFWLATVLAYVVFMVGCGVGHVYETVVHHNYAPMNAGWAIWLADGVSPILLAIIYAVYRRLLSSK